MLLKDALQRAVRLLISLAILPSFLPVSSGYATPAASSQPASIEQTPQQPTAHPAPLAQSLSLARVQNSYTAGTLDVIFTLSNNLPVTRVPTVPPNATDEELAALFVTFDPLQDANTLRGLILTDTLAAGVTLSATSGNVQQNGSTLTWQLPDLAPLSTTQVTLTLQTPSAGSSFIDLDDGAQATALRWGQAISAAARSAVIISMGIDAAYLAATSAADPDDPELIWYTSGFEQEPLAAFATVQSFRTDLYQGALRGTRGTLWGEAGNSLDKASALIAMLRAAGVPARYRHSTLNMAQAQTLITSLFPVANGMAGYVPIGTPLADPVNDAALIALASDHWWVEAYLPGSGWADLDPTYPQATIGQAFATPLNDGTDRTADVPTAVHHTLRVRLKREQYSSFPVGVDGIDLSTVVVHASHDLDLDVLPPTGLGGCSHPVWPGSRSSDAGSSRLQYLKRATRFACSDHGHAKSDLIHGYGHQSDRWRAVRCGRHGTGVESRRASGHRLRPSIDLARREWHMASAGGERRRASRHF